MGGGHRVLGVLLGLVYASGASAYYCDDYVKGLAINRGNEIYINSFAGSSWIGLCSTTVTENGVSPEACKSVYAALLAAQLAGKRVRLWFSDGLTCNTQQAWTIASGWYFGPQVLDD